MKAKLKKGLVAASNFICRYSASILLAWLGYIKLSNPGHDHVEHFLSTTLLFSWMMENVTSNGFTRFFGVIQLIAGILVGLKPLSKSLSAWGGALASILLLGSVAAYLFSGILWYSNPFVSMPEVIGNFLFTCTLLGVAAWCWADSI